MKNKINLLRLLISSIIIIGLSSCELEQKKNNNKLETALKLAGDNREELEKVLDHYKTSNDDLKLKASKFLIANMPYHSSSEEDKRFRYVFQRMKSFAKDTANNSFKKRKSFLGLLRRHKVHLEKNNINSNYNLNKDVKTLSSSFIIRNIELAFDAWYRIPKNKRASFEDFCNYILPYRVGNEPINEYSRLRLYKKYDWVYDEIKKGKSLKSIANKLILNFDFMLAKGIHAEYKPYFSINQIDLTKTGICDDGVNYFVNVFRALGIVSAKDFVTQWGNRTSTGHSWVYIKLGDEEYAAGFKGQDLNQEYKNKSVPKVNRRTFEYKSLSGFSPLDIDVTSYYVKVKDLEIKNRFNVEINVPVLCVFNTVTEWKPMHLGRYSWGTSNFKNVGVNVIYLPSSIDDQGNLTPINYPFYLTKDGKVDYFTPDNSFINSAKLLRKFGMDDRKRTWIQSLNGAEFQVSNDSSFNKNKTIYEIKDLHTTHFQKVEIADNNKYNYIRFKSNNKERADVATLAFYDVENNNIKGTFFTENFNKSNKNKPIKTAFDKDELTFSGGVDFTVGMKLSKPTQINSIGFQARNDQNHIVVNDEYELFYWNKKWLSLGKQQAKDTILYYNVPKNSLLWLKNKKGKEEHVFTIDEQTKNQKWLGYENDY